MTTFTITSSINIDALPGKSGNDTYIINGGALFIDQDSRFGYNNASTSAMGNITLSVTAGGTVEFNAQNVRLLVFSGSSGAVPLSNTLISSSNGAQGRLIGVWPSLSSSALTTGSAMPASGYLKLKSWNGITFNNSTLFGITGTTPGNDVAGWIEIAGCDSGVATVNRLNTFIVNGGTYTLGTTTGNAVSTYQFPSNGNNVYLPGVWVETGTSTGEYEFYPSAGACTASIASDSLRGKFCWVSKNGNVFFGSSSIGGYVPPAGRKITAPNILFSCTTSGAPTTNTLPNATLTTRYKFATTNGGVVSITNASFNWYLTFVSAYLLSLTNVSAATQINLSKIAQPMSLTNVGVGQEAANVQTGLNFTYCYSGGDINGSVFTRAKQNSDNASVVLVTDSSNLTFNNCKFMHISPREINNSNSWYCNRCSSITFNNPIICGECTVNNCSNIYVSGTTYYDCTNSTTSIAYPEPAFNVLVSNDNIEYDGLDFGGIQLCQPGSNLMTINASINQNIKMRNIGTQTNPIDLGGNQLNDIIWTRSTTTITCASNNHRLKTGDSIFVTQCSDISTIPIQLVRIVTYVDANTFTFTGINAGASSGTLCYYPTVTQYLVRGFSVFNLELKRIYTKHSRPGSGRAAGISLDNTSKGVLCENVWSDGTLNIPAALNYKIKGAGSPISPTAVASLYGTHFNDSFTCPHHLSSSISFSRLTGGTAATITSSLHNLTSFDNIFVLTSSNLQAMPIGLKPIVSVPTSSMFTVTCVNSGSTTGSITYRAVSSRLSLMMNEFSPESSLEGIYTIDAGNPQFTSAGTLYMPSVGDQITFTMPYYMIGHSGFVEAPPVLAGGLIQNYNLYYAIDKNDGTGFSAFKNLNVIKNGTYGTRDGASAIYYTASFGPQTATKYDYVFGTYITSGSYISNIASGTVPPYLVVNKNITQAWTEDIYLNHLPAETINPLLGAKLQIRIETINSNTDSISSLTLYTTNTNTTRGYQYPLDLGSLILTNLQYPCEVRVYEAGTTNEIIGEENILSNIWITDIDISKYQYVDISILSLGYQNIRYLSQYVGKEGLTLYVNQLIDRQYENL